MDKELSPGVTVRAEKGQPKTFLFTSSGYSSSGIDVSYIKSRRMLHFSGWYDNMVGIPPQTVSLRDFLTELGITRHDIEEALK